MRSFVQSLFLFMASLGVAFSASNALAWERIENYRCDSKHTPHGVLIGCFLRSSPPYNGQFIDSRTRFNPRTREFLGYELEELRNPNCTEDPYSGLEDCRGEPEYFQVRYQRKGRFLADFEQFKLLFEKFKGTIGTGQVRVQCANPREKSDCYYEVLNYTHMYWCEGLSCQRPSRAFARPPKRRR